MAFQRYEECQSFTWGVENVKSRLLASSGKIFDLQKCRWYALIAIVSVCLPSHILRNISHILAGNEGTKNVNLSHVVLKP